MYLSAEDLFRPVVPARYIASKREAEQRITQMLERSASRCRGVYIRPSTFLPRFFFAGLMMAGLVYHAHLRPLTTPLAALLDLFATVHAKAPSGAPTPSSILRALGSALGTRSETLPSTLDSIANALTIPPIHVEHVAKAICVALDPARDDVHGVVDVGRMRELVGWSR